MSSHRTSAALLGLAVPGVWSDERPKRLIVLQPRGLRQPGPAFPAGREASPPTGSTVSSASYMSRVTSVTSGHQNLPMTVATTLLLGIWSFLEPSHVSRTKLGLGQGAKEHG